MRKQLASAEKNDFLSFSVSKIHFESLHSFPLSIPSSQSNQHHLLPRPLQSSQNKSSPFQPPIHMTFSLECFNFYFSPLSLYSSYYLGLFLSQGQKVIIQSGGYKLVLAKLCCNKEQLQNIRAFISPSWSCKQWIITGPPST